MPTTLPRKNMLRKTRQFLGTTLHRAIQKTDFCLNQSSYFRFPKDAYQRIQNSTAILDEAKANFARASSLCDKHLPQSSIRWSTLMKRCFDYIARAQTIREAIEFAQTEMPFDHRVDVIHLFHAIAYYESLLELEYPDQIELLYSLQESPFSRPESHCKPPSSAKKRGKVSNIHYFHAHILLTCFQFADKMHNLLEIGAGYGNLCRLIFSQKQFYTQNYCIIDVPQSLFFAELFLRINLPTANIQYLSDEIPKLSTEKQNIILVPIQNAHLVKKMGIDFDLGINSGSLGELSEKWVDFWMNWLDEAPCSQFYSLNYCGTPLTNWAEGANTMAPHLSKRWQYKLSRPASPVIAMQAGGGRYFCDLLAQKMPEGELPSEEELSHRYQILKKRSFSRQTYIYSLDIARQTNTVGILLDILMRCANEFPYLPLESHWILEKLNSLPHDFLPEEDRGKLSSIEATIKAQYQRALHDLV